MTGPVREIIIEPMLALYLPPRHLRTDQKARALALAAYETALDRFDRDTLRRGWDKVVSEQTYWCWPNPGIIAEACRLFELRREKPNEEEQRRQQAHDMASAYTARYLKTSHVAKLAKREGWAGGLADYVHSAAWVLAQMICKVQHIGWDAGLARDLGPFHSSEEGFALYRKTIEKAVEKGQVRVTVPQSRIREWKERCRQKEPAVEPEGLG
jgi:hypothetical protein